MMEKWEDRSQIAANLLNPAFCGEIIRRTIAAYNNIRECKVSIFFALFNIANTPT